LKNVLKLERQLLSRVGPNIYPFKVHLGASGDNFYVVDQGNFDVIKDGVKVNSLGPGSSKCYIFTRFSGRSFGELALMYNAPRNATVQVSRMIFLNSKRQQVTLFVGRWIEQPFVQY
jgi:hypothetical protein